MHEYIGNPHVHSILSDGTGSLREISSAAIDAGLDFVILTDHNVYSEGLEGYYHRHKKRVLVLSGIEIHDASRAIQKDHLLAYGYSSDPSSLAAHPQRLIDTIGEEDGLTFLAHPVDPAAPAFDQPDLSWENWDIERFTGLEVWNFMSEFKSRLRTLPEAIYFSLFPSRICKGPFQETLRIWDSLLAQGHRVVGIGGSDGHALDAQLGPLRKVLFPYEFGFRAVNTHLLCPQEWSGDLEQDRAQVYRSLAAGHCFVGFDLAGETHGFRFTAQSDHGTFVMGDRVSSGYGVTLQIRCPRRSEIRLICNGEVIQHWPSSEIVVRNVMDPGAYRVEVFTSFLGRRTGWIYSNPIYFDRQSPRGHLRL